jgi:hypothetical protein
VGARGGDEGEDVEGEVERSGRRREREEGGGDGEEKVRVEGRRDKVGVTANRREGTL